MSAKKDRPGLSHFAEFLKYEPDTGNFIWLKQRKRITANSIAGCKAKSGYIQIICDGFLCEAHRLAHLFMTGMWPEGQIDHINTVKTDNRWKNLRAVSKHTNSENRRVSNKNNKSGFLGVCHTPSGTYRASIGVNSKMLFLGIFKTPEEAHQAYVDAKRKLHTGCTL